MKFRCGSHSGAVPHKVQGSADLSSSVLTAIDREALRRIRVASVLGAERSQRFAGDAFERWGIAVEFARSCASVGELTNGYAAPETLGVDRWLALLAAYHRWRTAVLVIDLGTAVTLDYVDQQGGHLGGYIVPGSHLMRSTLVKDTADIDVRGSTTADTLLPGGSTAEAVSRGTLLALKHLVEGEIRTFSSKFPNGCVSVLCGGGSAALAPHIQADFVVLPDLVLDGLSVALPEP